MGADYFERWQDGRRSFGLRIEPAHCHARGFAHGGFLLAVADFVLSHGTFDPGDLPPRITLHLEADFFRPAAMGEWLDIEVNFKKTSERLVFADCMMRVGDRDILRASGLFQPLRSKI